MIMQFWKSSALPKAIAICFLVHLACVSRHRCEGATACTAPNGCEPELILLEDGYTYVLGENPPAAKDSAKAKKQAALKKAKSSHKLTFYDNDFSYLSDPYYEGRQLGDSMKQLKDPFGGTWDFGGQLRTRFHHEDGMKGPQRFTHTTDNFQLTRLRAYANYQMTPWLRFYSEGIFADSAYENVRARGIDENHGDLLNAFADVKLTDHLTSRVGRQELVYGSQRLVSCLDWANTRRRFDAAKLMYRSDDWAIDGFYSQFVPVLRDEFDEPDSDQPFYGAYATYSGFQDTLIDTYYLGSQNDNVGRKLHTVGVRYLETAGKWQFEIEGGVQWGKRATNVTQSDEGFATVGIGRNFPDTVWKPSLWFYYDFASDHFNHLYPLAHKYLGFIDAVQRSNIESPNVRLVTKPSDKLTLTTWYYHFQSNDALAVPAIGGTPNQSANRYYGNELDFTAKYALSARSGMLLGWSHLWRGEKILNPQDADFVYLQYHVNF